MNKVKPNEFVVHCILCGKNFRVGDTAKCGGTGNGRPLCRTGDIQRELDSRLHQKPPTEKEKPRDAETARGSRSSND